MENQELIQFGLLVKKRRLEQNLSQEQLALSCDLDRTYISSIERGKRNVGLLNIIKIAKALNVEPSQLLTFDGYLNG
ncbi:helix-turn-helix transcriptional regulator [Motilimonas cestriensis]|uniref:Helix-turn-helix transcriptional regulator n=1 Tax=Motilimonas cestriensis TaxID=2742685 RepID=A0ABS8W8A0_9GAMM|nr:helix-turn-helix transcriptional regulator [Motilimonas cestriensis]MCE2593973.1 helix-turn-helix transcriptional regulator [Motilimonas cestriensis]